MIILIKSMGKLLIKVLKTNYNWDNYKVIIELEMIKILFDIINVCIQ